MHEGRTILLINMLAAELGYEIKWGRRPDGSLGNFFRLDNNNGESFIFRGPKKYEQALQWLRNKA